MYIKHSANPVSDANVNTQVSVQCSKILKNQESWVLKEKNRSFLDGINKVGGILLMILCFQKGKCIRELF